MLKFGQLVRWGEAAGIRSEAMKTAIEGSEGPQAFPAQVMKRGDLVMGDDFCWQVLT